MAIQGTINIDLYLMSKKSSTMKNATWQSRLTLDDMMSECGYRGKSEKAPKLSDSTVKQSLQCCLIQWPSRLAQSLQGLQIAVVSWTSTTPQPEGTPELV